MEKKKATTPMMQQYLSIREGLADNTLLLFRLGDFYELFHEDAKDAASLLGLTLTQRNGNVMAGLPYHAAETYINKLLALGKKVAICDQVESPTPGKLVKRSLTRILTPGTKIEASHLDAVKNNYLLAITFVNKSIQAAWLDLSTGDFQISTESNPEELFSVFYSIDPKEVILPEWASQTWKTDANYKDWWESFEYFSQNRTLSFVSDYQFDLVSGSRSVIEALGVLNLDGFGIDKRHDALGAAGALIYYATETLCSSPKNLFIIREYKAAGSLIVDPATLKNLEIFQSSQNIREGSLIGAMDGTVTAAGARLLEQFLAMPVLDLAEIKRRHRCVSEFVEESGLSLQLQELLKSIRDLSRILTRLQNRSRNPRELGTIRDTLVMLPEITSMLNQFEGLGIRALGAQINNFDELRERLQKALNAELPSKLEQSGDVIARGYDLSLDQLLELAHGSKQWVAEFEQKEQAATGIRNLKIKFNNAFGYFIEVTKSNLDRVPDHYIRRQTMTNAERYYTEELKFKEREILEAEGKALEYEEVLLTGLINLVLQESVILMEAAEALAEIDLFVGWAQIAREWDYCCPYLDELDRLDIEQGRHPVVEQMLRKDRLAKNQVFVPNDTFLSASEEQIAVVTGPNMAGKSTYIRQVALIALMAQVGSWVPAKSCHIGLVDRIFSRVGASDELARGNSTFMVEMNETANILNNATDRSLIVLDEIGRGTSTYDGLSIAWAVVEHLHGKESRGPKTLFATHYHELPQLEGSLKRLRNYNVVVKEWNDEIIFVRQVVPGSADKSYGIQVARLAGLPNSVIDRANEILGELESSGCGVQEQFKGATYSTPSTNENLHMVEEPGPKQLSLF